METETVTRLRATSVTDPYSEDDAEDWSAPTELALTTLAPAAPRPAQLEGRPSPEPVQNARNAVTSGFTLYLSTDADVTARDRMRVRGRVYDVLGDPALWLSAGLVVQVGTTEG